MSLILSVFPIVLLIWLMVKKKSMPSYKAIPLVAVVLLLTKLLYFKTEPVMAAATLVNGLLTALTPILIVWGAIFLFKAMEHSGAMDVIRQWLNGITENRVAQIMIIAWAFSFLIEGASGFGTPAAIAAPILVGLGFDPLATVVVCLIFNSVPVTFGAVGVPTWFGFGELGLTAGQIVKIGFESAVVNTAAAFIIAPVGLLFIVPWKEIKANIVYVYLSVLACVVPYVIVAAFNYEFPSIIGGFIGTVLSIVLAKRQIGLVKGSHLVGEVPAGKVIRASFALWATVLVLLITRIDQLGIKGLLNSAAHSVKIGLGSVGEMAVSPSLVVSWANIFGTSTNWTHKFLYVPSIIPFFVIGFLSFWVVRSGPGEAKAAWNESIHRLKHPIMALLATLVFAKLLMEGRSQSNTMIIGRALADAAGAQWYWFSSLLGALGSFFAGSNTVSNLTFAPIQDSIASSLNLNRIVILTMQSVGGAMGKMVCIHDIVAVSSVIGITGFEGYIIKRTAIPMFIYAVLAAISVPLLLLIFG